MKTWNYTKKLIVDNKTEEGANAHLENSEQYEDWYYSQIDAGLADNTRFFTEYEWTSPSVCEILVTDQAQAESFIAMATALGEKIGFPVTGIIVDYTE